MNQFDIDSHFRKKNPSDVEALLSIVDLLVYKDASNNKILALYNLLGQELFIKTCLLLNGEKLDLPTATDMTETLTFALCYLEKFIHGLNWGDIRKKYPSLGINSFKFSTLYQSLEDYIKKILQEETNKHKEVNGL